MTADHSNPAAFPSVCLNDPGHEASVPGMTLRDWFAGRAVTGLIASAEGGVDAESYAEGAYAIADAMLAARNAPCDEGDG